MYGKNKPSESKTKLREAGNCYKRVLGAAKFEYAKKTKESITSQKLGCQDFWRIANSILNKVTSAIPPLFNSPSCCLLIKKNCLLKKNSNLDDLGISLPVFPFRTKLKPHNISATPKMVKKVIKNVDLSTASGPDCIPVVVLKNC